MKNFLVISFLFLLSIWGCQRSGKGHEEKNQILETHVDQFTSNKEILLKIKEIDSLLKKLTLDKNTAGVSFGIQVDNSQPYLATYGYANVGQKLKVKSSTEFRIASVTKPFTATAIALLIEQGSIALNDPINKFFPGFPNGGKVTIYQLLSHTSGIPNWWEGGLPEDTPENFPMCETPHKYIQGMDKVFHFEPGTKHAYSNSGYVLLGEIIEQVSGKSYSDFLKLKIFSPSKMKNTQMVDIYGSSDHWAQGYALDSKKEKLFIEPVFIHMPFAAGGLQSNVSDLLSFANTLFEDRLIGKSLLNQMTSYAKVINEKPVYEALYFPADFSPPAPPKNMKKNGYGLGFSLMEVNGKPIIWHSGGIPGFNSIWA
ncbi:serine hydrolase domain-containing protein, partial [Xanthovirga aplysinae]|uniref:serine hydrolase domain-containing protein n=1 Tax=Xanthovirga aplysinae TaxID=2529853 RepID=UPI0012BD3A37